MCLCAQREGEGGREGEIPPLSGVGLLESTWKVNSSSLWVRGLVMVIKQEMSLDSVLLEEFSVGGVDGVDGGGSVVFGRETEGKGVFSNLLPRHYLPLPCVCYS